MGSSCYRKGVSVAFAPVPSDHIETTPGVCGGKPRIRGTRIKISLVALLHVHQGRSVDEILEDYPHLSLAQVHAALSYYFDHREAIEQQLREEEDTARRLAPAFGATFPEK